MESYLISNFGVYGILIVAIVTLCKSGIMQKAFNYVGNSLVGDVVNRLSNRFEELDKASQLRYVDLLKRAEDIERRRKATDNGIKCLLRNEIRQAHKYYVQQKHPMSIDAYDDISECMQCYESLGGNGRTHKLWEDINKLHLSSLISGVKE